ncbi:hypothetical protein ABXN37_01115 [Piscinibacter sakaiensis]|uniref:hypothetical protein n=1 Tax=Piscinibacter sakaiensis TaxID=1547922 RepID=UPI003728F7FE
MLVERLGGLCDELVGSLGALAEDASWAEGPADAVRARLTRSPSCCAARGSASSSCAASATRRAMR